MTEHRKDLAHTLTVRAKWFAGEAAHQKIWKWVRTKWSKETAIEHAFGKGRKAARTISGIMEQLRQGTEFEDIDQAKYTESKTTLQQIINEWKMREKQELKKKNPVNEDGSVA